MSAITQSNNSLQPTIRSVHNVSMVQAFFSKISCNILEEDANNRYLSEGRSFCVIVIVLFDA